MPEDYGFGTAGNGDFVLRIEPLERELLRSLALQMVEFVSPPPTAADADPLEEYVGITPGAEQSDDPGLARLLPDAFKDDPAAAAEFRRYTERGLRAAKAANAAKVAAALEGDEGPVEIPAADVGAWLGMLNDSRLVFGERVGITEDNHEELAALPAADPRLATYHVYDWLTFLEDSLVQLRLEAIGG